MRRNPPLVIYGNPRQLLRSTRESDIIARHVAAIIYVHNEDGGLYVHGFGEEPKIRNMKGQLILSGLSHDSNVRAIAMRDGSVRLVHADGLTLWGEY